MRPAPLIRDELALRPQAPLEQFAVVRRLEGTERLTAVGNALHGGNFNVVAAIAVEGPVTETLLQHALEEVQRHYESLNVEVVPELGGSGEWVFRRTDARPRLEVTNEDWRDVWHRLGAEVIAGLAWRVVWTGTHLVVLFHHAVTDAVSLTVFFDRLLETMFRTVQGVPEIGPMRPMTAPLHALAGSQWPARAITRIVSQRLFGGLQTGPLARAPQGRRWYSAFRIVEPKVAQQLVERSRAEGVTLTHALSASIALELAGRVTVKPPFTVAVCTSVDLRRVVPGADRRQLGLLSCAVHSFFRMRGEDALWPLAKEAGRQLHRAFSRNEHRDMPQLHRFFGARFADWLAGQNEGRTPDCALLVSNVGRVDGLEHGPFRAETLFVTGSQAAWGNTFILVAATVRGRMCVHLGFATPTIAVDEGEAVLTRTLARLSSA